jgi:hypothetical protein
VSSYCYPITILYLAVVLEAVVIVRQSRPRREDLGQ